MTTPSRSGPTCSTAPPGPDGDGEDLFQVAYDYDEMLLDLRRGQFETGAPDVTVDQRVSNVENVDAVSARMTVKGTSNGNVLNLQGCEIWAVGRAGTDTIGYGVDIANAPALTCAARRWSLAAARTPTPSRARPATTGCSATRVRTWSTPRAATTSSSVATTTTGSGATPATTRSAAAGQRRAGWQRRQRPRPGRQGQRPTARPRRQRRAGRRSGLRPRQRRQGLRPRLRGGARLERRALSHPAR